MTAQWTAQALTAVEQALTPTSDPLEFRAPQAANTHGEHQVPSWVQRPDAAQFDGDAVAAVVRTSGSTGTPKQTLLSAAALEASAQMTESALGGPGQWLLALHPSYVAGLSVLTRSVFSGTTPHPLLQNTTDASEFTRAAGKLNHERRFTALVPTQLARLMEQADPESQTHTTDGPALLEALQSFHAILIGGGPTSATLFDRCRALGLAVIRTYGMTETCGGCVYDGYPLPGVTVSTGTRGRVLLSGPMVALGYHEDAALTAAKFDEDPATAQRRLRTDDLGTLTTHQVTEIDSVAHVAGFGHSAQIIPHLSITGRADDVIITGGVKVSADQVRTAIESHPQVREAFVVGIDDDRWGEKVAAAVVLAGISRGGSAVEEIDELVRTALGPACVPKHYELLTALPLLPSGKPDRAALHRLLTDGGPV